MGVYLETQEDSATSNLAMDQTGGSARATYIINSQDAFNLQGTITDILGYTNPFAGTTQKMRRTIPLTHPKLSYLYASKIVSIVGEGSGTAYQQSPTPPALPIIGSRPIAPYYQYAQYRVGVEFTGPRPYAILNDGAFNSSASSSIFYPADGGAGVAFTYAAEWLRYTEFDLYPQDNTIQGQTGGLALIKNSTTTVPFTSPPWMWLPDQILKITWYQVPLRYIISPNSYIANRDWRGRVNQNDWWLWPKGSLLYLGYGIKKYSPPTGDVQTSPANEPYRYINYAQLCDVELNFLLTKRVLSGSLGAAITNLNYIAAGHNLLPDMSDMKFYYATSTTPTISVQNRPPWLSFPVEILMSDPDVNTLAAGI